MAFKVTVGQLKCDIGDKEANLQRIENFVAAAGNQGTDILVLPERIMMGSIFGDRAKRLAESIPGEVTDRLGEVASEHSLYLVTGMLERDGDDFYNVSVMHSPDGEIVGVYRKWHLFDSEKKFVKSGDQPAIFDIEFGRIALSICYDLVFPEFIRGLVLNGVDLILNSTNWITDDRQFKAGWNGEVVSRLAATRALENGVHIAMANRTGVIDEDWWSLGHSSICRPSGSFEARIKDGEGLASAVLDIESDEWEQWRKVATYLPDRRPEIYRQLNQERQE